MRKFNLLCLPLMLPMFLLLGLAWLLCHPNRPRSRRLAFGVGLAASLLLPFSACTTTPTATQVQAITNACAIDAGIRPIMTELLAVPGLANPQETAAVVAARAVIDPICANPSATPQANALAALTGASAQIIGIVTTLKARQAAPLPAAPKATAYRTHAELAWAAIAWNGRTSTP